jgi:MFS family permease
MSPLTVPRTLEPAASPVTSPSKPLGSTTDTPLAPVEKPVRRSALRALRVRNYRLYSGGQLISLTGTWMQRVAQDWLVLELTGSGTALGITTALQFGPSLFLGLWAGVIADRVNKRFLLIATQCALALIAATLGILTITGVVQLWEVFAIALLLGTTNALDAPARQSFVVEMVGREDLVNAVGLNSMLFNIGRVFGPLIAGALISEVGIGWAFIANSFTGLAVITALVMLRAGELYPSKRVERAPGQVRAGVSYVRSRVDLWAVIVLMAAIGTFGFNFQFTTALLVKLTFHRDAASYGLMTASLAVGACVGALLAARRQRRPGLTLIFGLAAGFCIAEVLCGIMPTFAATTVMLLPTGALMISLATAANASVQLGVAPTMRGRVVALYFVAFQGGTFLGAPLIGGAAQLFGPRWGLISGALAGAIAIVVLTVAVCRVHGVRFAQAVARRRELLHRAPPAQAQSG